MNKDIQLLIIEGIIVGLGLILVFNLTTAVLDKLSEEFNFNKFNLPVLLFLSGFIFHIACEYSGINIWYSLKYCEILNK